MSRSRSQVDDKLTRGQKPLKVKVGEGEGKKYLLTWLKPHESGGFTISHRSCPKNQDTTFGQSNLSDRQTHNTHTLKVREVGQTFKLG